MVRILVGSYIGIRTVWMDPLAPDVRPVPQFSGEAGEGAHPRPGTDA